MTPPCSRRFDFAPSLLRAKLDQSHAPAGFVAAGGRSLHALNANSDEGSVDNDSDSGSDTFDWADISELPEKRRYEIFDSDASPLADLTVLMSFLRRRVSELSYGRSTRQLGPTCERQLEARDLPHELALSVFRFCRHQSQVRVACTRTLRVCCATNLH